MLNKIAKFLGNFCYKYRKFIGVFAIVLLIAVIILESMATISYHYSEENLVTELFPSNDTLVIIYDNRDEEKMSELIAKLEEDEKVVSIQAYANTLGMPLSSREMAENFGIDETFVKALFIMQANDMNFATITVKEFANFVSSDDFINNPMLGSMVDEEMKSQMLQFNAIVEAIHSNEPMTSNAIADLLGVDINLVKTLLFFSQGQVDTVVFRDFVGTIGKASESFGFAMDAETMDQLSFMQTLTKLVVDNKQLNATELSDLMCTMADSDMLTPANMKLLVAMVKGANTDMSEVRIPLYDIFCFLSDNFINNYEYAALIDPEMKQQFTDAAAMINDGKAQLVGSDHSRMVLSTLYRHETDAMTEFHKSTMAMFDEVLEHEFYFVGESALSQEVRNTFDTEYLVISIITAIAVLIVVCITFKSFFLPVLLVTIIECSIFAMMSVMTVINHSMFFIALILVQCILMGSMIDYAILLTTYYVEVRKELPASKALPEVMKRALHAILTSGSILVIVAFVCGSFMEGQVASILTTLGIGALCALILILFVLPALLVLFDRKVTARLVWPVPVNEAVPEPKISHDIDPNQLTFDDVIGS